jgi:hypothetical protein
VPDHMAHGIWLYFSQRREAGDFLMAVIRNDLKEACRKADSWNQSKLFNFVSLFYNEAPSFNWGHEGKVKDWFERVEVG